MAADPGYDAVTAAQQRTWSDGDFSMVASLVVHPSENLVEALEILPDERVLDVACGSGPPPGTQPPVPWGREEQVRELFGDGIAELRTERRANRQAFRSPDHYLDFFRAYFGPLRSAFEQVGPEGAPALEADMREYLEKVRGDARALVIEPEYLQLVAVRA